MKKKLLLIVSMVALLVCLLAVCVNADEAVPERPDYNTTYTINNTAYPIWELDETGYYHPLMWYKDGEVLKSVRADNTDNTKAPYIVYSSYTGGTSREMQNFNIYDENGNVFNGKTTVVIANLHKIYIKAGDANELTHIHANAFQSSTVLKVAYVPETISYMGWSGSNHNFSSFKGCTALEFVWFPNTVNFTKLSNNSFEGCESLKYIKLPQNLTSIESICFQNCKSLKWISIPDGVTKIGGAAFYNCTSLEAVYLPSSLVTFETLNDHWGQGVFGACDDMYFVSTPIPFSENAVMPEKQEVYYMPSGLIEVGTNSNSGGPFVGCKSINQVIVFPTGVTNLITGDGLLKDCGSSTRPVNAVFLGDIESLKTNSQNERANYVNYFFVNENDLSLDSLTFSNTHTNNPTAGYLYFCRSGKAYEIKGSGTTNHCVLLENVTSPHLIEPKRTVITQTADCEKVELSTTYCFCSAIIQENVQTADALGHDVSEIPVIVYANNNFFAKGCAEYRCTRNNCTHFVSNEVNAIFTALGYTKTEAENPSVALMQSFDVDTSALKAYKEYGESEIRYGVIAVRETEAVKAGSDVMNANGEYTAEKGGFAEFKDTNYSEFNIKVAGIGTNKDVKLFVCACILVGNDGDYESYYATMAGEELSLSTTLQGSICYNDITKTVSE